MTVIVDEKCVTYNANIEAQLDRLGHELGSRFGRVVGHKEELFAVLDELVDNVGRLR